MASFRSATNGYADDQILAEGNSNVKVVKLNRPEKFNAINYHMTLKLLKIFRALEKDPNVELVILKGNGKVFCSGGDLSEIARYAMKGHWSFATHFDKKILQLEYMVATFKKSMIFLINGLTAGMGAGLCMLGKFRVVTENAIFTMPEVKIGHFPDCGASYFLSRIPGFLGEYIGLTGARLDGAEMLACGLATHFVPSGKLSLLEAALHKVDTEDPTVINAIINQYTHVPSPRNDGLYQRLNIINKHFSKTTVEEILASLEQEAPNGQDEWISSTIKSIKKASPTNLKIFLRSIREGRQQDIAACLVREYRMTSHVLRGTVCRDLFEGIRAKLWDKDNRPKWVPSKLELVTKDMINAYFTELEEDEGWESLQLPFNFMNINTRRAKL